MHHHLRRPRLAPIGALGLLLVASACESLAERSKHLTSASAFEWTNERFKIAGESEMWGQVGVHDGKLSFFAKGFPPGTRFTIGTATATVGEDGNGQLEAPAQGLYGVLPFATVEMPTLEGATMKVEAPGAAGLDVPLPPIRVAFPGSLLLEAAKGPVPFASDDPGDETLDNIVLDPAAQAPMVVGTAPKTLGDVDAVAIMTLSPTGQTKECTGYVDEQGTAMPSVQLKLARTTVAVHVRRTGQQLATKEFAAVEQCPESFMKWSDEDSTSLRPYIPVGEIEPWLASVLAGR